MASSDYFNKILNDILESAPAVAPVRTKPVTKPATPARPSPFNPPKPAQLPKPKAEDDLSPRAAPAVAPVRTKPVTKPTTPTRPSPFNPPKPAQLPKPKACAARTGMVNEAFDSNVNRYVRDFYDPKKRTQHSMHQHPLFGMYGAELAGRQYAGAKEGYQRHFGSTEPGQIGMRTHQAFMLCRRVEASHIAELEKLAVDLVSNATGVPRELFKAYLGSHMPPESEEEGPDVDFQHGSPDVRPVEDPGKPVDIRSEANKRMTMNALSQGHALHSMDSMHHLISQELNEIDPMLLKSYSQFSTGSRSHFYFTSLIKDLQDAAVREMGRAGFTEVKWEMDSGASGENEGHHEIVAYGAVFPVLVQELVKGAMELISLHQFEGMSRADVKKIYDYADKAEDEPWYFLVGPQLWKMLLKVVPDHSRIPDLVMQLARSKPEVVHRLLANLIEEIHADRSVEHIKAELIELLQELDDLGADVESSDFVDIDADYEEDAEGEDEDEEGETWDNYDDLPPYEDR
jgi:hypothetical protein